MHYARFDFERAVRLDDAAFPEARRVVLCATRFGLEVSDDELPAADWRVVRAPTFRFDGSARAGFDNARPVELARDEVFFFGLSSSMRLPSVTPFDFARGLGEDFLVAERRAFNRGFATFPCAVVPVFVAGVFPWRLVVLARFIGLFVGIVTFLSAWADCKEEAILAYSCERDCRASKTRID